MDLDNAYNLHGPNGIIDNFCDGDACGRKLPHPETGQYYCEAGFDGLSVKSQLLAINSTIDDENPPTQSTTTATQTPSIGQIKIITISVGGVGVLLLLALIVAIVGIIVLYRRVYNGYQLIPPSKITHKTLNSLHSIYLVLHLYDTLYCHVWDQLLEGFPPELGIP